jgi:hypothetical protein
MLDTSAIVFRSRDQRLRLQAQMPSKRRQRIKELLGATRRRDWLEGLTEIC